MEMFEKIYTNHVLPCFNNPTKVNLEYALYLIDDSLEHLGEFFNETLLL